MKRNLEGGPKEEKRVTGSRFYPTDDGEHVGGLFLPHASLPCRRTKGKCGRRKSDVSVHQNDSLWCMGRDCSAKFLNPHDEETYHYLLDLRERQDENQRVMKQVCISILLVQSLPSPVIVLQMDQKLGPPFVRRPAIPFTPHRDSRLPMNPALLTSRFLTLPGGSPTPRIASPLPLPFVHTFIFLTPGDELGLVCMKQVILRHGGICHTETLAEFLHSVRSPPPPVIIMSPRPLIISLSVLAFLRTRRRHCIYSGRHQRRSLGDIARKHRTLLGECLATTLLFRRFSSHSLPQETESGWILDPEEAKYENGEVRTIAPSMRSDHAST